MEIGALFTIFVSAALVNNFVLARFLGICPFLGVSKQIETAFGMGMAVTFVMTLSSIITYIIQVTILDNLGLQYLQWIAFILVIASLVQFVELFVKKASPGLYQALGVFLPLITTNCAVLGLAILNIQEEYNLIQTTIHAVGASVGFLIAIVLFAGIRERVALADVPELLKGFPIALITAGLMSIAFLGFTGLV
ncbi:electron transport complex subunit RsxA [Sporosalibacterium faouarense]|uniref:electron transport complex subunit RsxA n=1 Tax=Sporosalibacterium faouarense TaxID=516123 RepID=UPI00141D434D|nr:electron transport complex subunit RsxA [Sporosalibacterium faouarense]MTI48549.1 electron transport complex subunit RsxA [Bacillota bacterium]